MLSFLGLLLLVLLSVATSPGASVPISEEGCEGDNILLECSNANEYIEIDDVFFGRSNNNTCNNGSVLRTNCSSPSNAMGIVGKVCNGRKKCYFTPWTSVFGDPCPGTVKVAAVKYNCRACANGAPEPICVQMASLNECGSVYPETCRVQCHQCDNSDCGNTYSPAASCDLWAAQGECVSNPSWMLANCRESCRGCGAHTVFQPFCEGQYRMMSCASGYSLNVLDISWGRQNRDTCNHTSIFTLNCSTPTDALQKAKEQYNGKQQGYVHGSNQNWGDPCPGTSKQGSITYECTACADTMSNCASLSDQCSTNSTVYQQCFQTCTNCGQNDCGNAVSNNQYCDYWALKGDCARYSRWHLLNCKTSCGFCDKPLQVDEVFCEGNRHRVYCPAGYYMKVKDVFWGRQDRDTCDHQSIFVLNCTTPPDLLDKIKTLFDGRSAGVLNAFTGNLGEPCSGTYKQGRISYECLECSDVASNCASMGDQCSLGNSAYEQCFKTCTTCGQRDCGNAYRWPSDCDYWAMNGDCEMPQYTHWHYQNCRESCNFCHKPFQVNQPFCEGQNRKLHCLDGQVLQILDIFWGRTDRDTCDHQSIFVLNCTTPAGLLDKAKQQYDGRTSAWISGSTSSLTDPCPGTSKQGNVQYQCVECVDLVSNCASLSDQCSTNTTVYQQCFKTCTNCGQTSCGNSYSNNEYDCDFWRMRGDCTSQLYRDFQYANCKESCALCNVKAEFGICEGTSRNLTCDGGQTIEVVEMFWGRVSSTVCQDNNSTNTNCPPASGTLQQAQSLFNGKSSSTLEALTAVWGDPCPGTSKYGYILYRCI